MKSTKEILIEFYNNTELMIGLGVGIISTGLTSVIIQILSSSLFPNPIITILFSTLILGIFLIYRGIINFKRNKRQ